MVSVHKNLQVSSIYSKYINDILNETVIVQVYPSTTITHYAQTTINQISHVVERNYVIIIMYKIVWLLVYYVIDQFIENHALQVSNKLSAISANTRSTLISYPRRLRKKVVCEGESRWPSC